MSDDEMRFPVRKNNTLTLIYLSFLNLSTCVHYEASDLDIHKDLASYTIDICVEPCGPHQIV